jgi:hypothetical protein
MRFSMAAAAIALTAACSHHQMVLDPARFDLHPYGRLALMQFTIENAKGSLQQVATRRFSEAVLAAQPGIELLELAPADSARARELPVMFLGHIKVSNVKPSASLNGLLSVPRVEAKVTVELSVQLVSTTTGGTLWRASSIATETIGKMGISGGLPYFSAEDPDEAYGALVGYLVRQVTWDFRPTWRRM